jgi:hypothetical protein
MKIAGRGLGASSRAVVNRREGGIMRRRGLVREIGTCLAVGIALSMGATAAPGADENADVGDPFIYSEGKQDLVKSWLTNNGWEVTVENPKQRTIWAKKNSGQAAVSRKLTAPPAPPITDETSGDKPPAKCATKKCPRCNQSDQNLYFCLPVQPSCVSQQSAVYSCGQVVYWASAVHSHGGDCNPVVVVGRPRRKCCFW